MKKLIFFPVGNGIKMPEDDSVRDDRTSGI